MNQAATAADTSSRIKIFAAADFLYREADCAKFPTVDAVRRQAQADMNSVSLYMKEWRQNQTTQAAPVVVVTVPEAVQAAQAQAAATTWQQATELANQSLRSAQQGWEAERTGFDSMRVELATAYEAAAAAAEEVKNQLAIITGELDKERAQHVATAETAAQHTTDLHNQLATATARAATAEARTIEIERRVDDLKATAAAADQAHADQRKAAAAELEAERTRHVAAAAAAQDAHKTLAARLDVVADELATAKATAAATDQAHADQRKAAAAETQRAADRMIKIEAELTQARKEAAAAREESARLQGHTEAMKAQAADLMRALADRQEATPAKPAKGAKS